VQSASVRAQCSSILLMFLLDYPLGEPRLDKHLEFLVSNLEFKHESGREAALDALKVSHPLQSMTSTLLYICSPLCCCKALCAWVGGARRLHRPS
jgi:hypothetical protein